MINSEQETLEINIIKIKKDFIYKHYSDVIRLINPRFPFSWKEYEDSKKHIDKSKLRNCIHELSSSLNAAEEIKDVRNDQSFTFRVIDDVFEQRKRVSELYNLYEQQELIWDNMIVEKIAFDYCRFKYMKDDFWFLPFKNEIEINNIEFELLKESQGTFSLKNFFIEIEKLNLTRVTVFRSSILSNFFYLNDESRSLLIDNLSLLKSDDSVSNGFKDYIMSCKEDEILIFDIYFGD